MADVTLPSLGESVTEGIITQWFKKVGDAVSRDEPLFEVSTDKVDSEMPSPFSGVLTQIFAEEGDTVETGAKVCVIDENATGGNTASTPAPAGDAAPAPAPKVASAPVASSNGPSGLLLSPVVRRILADGQVEPSTIKGTGPGGSITRRDAERAVANGPTEQVLASISNGMRRMGQHMAVSSQSIPQGFVAIEVDAAHLVQQINAVGGLTGASKDIAISAEMVIGLSAVRALKEFAFLNGTYENNELTLHRTINVGFVRNVDDEGMLVPVVHAAADLKLKALAQRIVDVDARVASRQLTADDLMGGTFTVLSAPSNHTLYTQPIIIAPEVAVLSFGAVREVPVVANGVVAPGWRVVLGLSYDHRVCESFVAAKYLERVGQLLSEVDLEVEA